MRSHKVAHGSPVNEQREDDEKAVRLESRDSACDAAPGQQAQRHAPAVERRDRQQVERHQHQIHHDPMSAISRVRRWPAGPRRCRGRQSTTQPQRHREIRAGPRGRHPDHVALRMAQVAEIDRHRLRPAEHERRAGYQRATAAPGTSIVPTGSMCFNGFSETRPSISAVRSPNMLRHVAVGGFMQGDREDHRHSHRARWSRAKNPYSGPFYLSPAPARFPRPASALTRSANPSRAGSPPPRRTTTAGSTARSITVVGAATQGPASMTASIRGSQPLADRFRSFSGAASPGQDQRRRQDRLAEFGAAARARPRDPARARRSCCASDAAGAAEPRASPAAGT